MVSKKNFDTLKKATQQYQPKTKDYKRIVLNKINPELWKKFKEFKSLTGYSLSCILRILLEWEMQDKGLDINPLLQRGNIPLPEFFSSNFFFFRCITMYIVSGGTEGIRNFFQSF